MDFQALFSKTIWYEYVQLLQILKQSESESDNETNKWLK